MSDWQAGDIALCVGAIKRRHLNGCVFTVKSTWVGPHEVTSEPTLGLRFVDLPLPHNLGAWCAHHFVKITPGHKITGSEVDQKEPWGMGV